MIYLERPVFLLLMILVPVFLVLRKAGILRRPAFSATLGDWGSAPLVWQSSLMRLLRVASTVCIFLAFFLAVITLSGPVFLHTEAVFSGTGNTVIFVLDVSPSMAAADMDSVTRLDAGRGYIRSFVENRSGTAFSLIALGSSAALVVPPTADHRLFLERLDALAIGEFGDGTAIGLALAIAAAHANPADGTPVSVILLTDGENNAGSVHPETAASVLASRGASLYVVGIGSRGTVPVDYIDPVSGVQYSGFLESDYNEQSLSAISASGGGTFMSVYDTKALQDVFASLEHSVPVVPSQWTRTVEEPLHGVLLRYILALAAFSWICRRVFMGAIL